MIKKISISILIMILNLSIINCSANVADKDFDSLNVKIVDVQSWLNLMPGGPGSFHISGKYELPENMNEKEIFLDKIIVLDSEKEIYNLTAELQIISISPNGIKEFTFTNNYQTKIEPILMEKENIDIQLVFRVNDKPIKKDLNKVPLTRAY